MKQIVLTQGKFALVDDEDYSVISKFKWCAALRGAVWYATRGVHCAGKSVTINMHSVITRAPSGMHVDHANGNGLDNRRQNLRVATRSQNQANASKRRGKNPYKGVFPVPRGWIARVKANHVAYYLGFFKSPEAAARAYDRKAIELYGKFAYPNFPISVGM